MTEERLEEIWQTWRVGTSSIKDLIRAVAAEVRNEAIDEFLKKVKMGWKYRADEKTVTLHELDEVATRLKEQERV